MTSDRQVTSRLFITTVIEGRTENDEKFEKCYNNVTKLISNVSEKEAHDNLNKSSEDRKVHDELCIGLLVGILSDPPMAQRLFNDLTLISRDSLKSVCDAVIHHVVGERFSRLLDVARKQLLWLVRELIKANVSNVENVVWCLLRQIVGGDVSPKNLQLTESLLDILRDNRLWLDKYSIIVASVTYTYLRILEDHCTVQLVALRQKEVEFVVSLLRERFMDCLMIGRDLVRLLQNVARIPEIEAFWRDLLHNPSSLAPGFTGLLQLLQTRTSRRFFVVRLTPEMEKKMVFLCSDVKFGMQKRYQDWFQRQYLNTPEAQTLRCDLIRFIIGCIHPTNEVLCSDIIPRWAVIGWLLSSCTSPVATANSKLALFYDWLFYNPDTDSIMNIEPGILVMYHSMKAHPVLTTSLLDFLCRIIPNFHPVLTEQVRGGVNSSLRQILEKRVVPSLEPLFDNPKMDTELRKLVRETFLEFCSIIPDPRGIGLSPDDFVGVAPPPPKMDLIAEVGLELGGRETDHHATVNHGDEDAAFSDEDEDGSSCEAQGARGRARPLKGDSRKGAYGDPKQEPPVQVKVEEPHKGCSDRKYSSSGGIGPPRNNPPPCGGKGPPSPTGNVNCKDRGGGGLGEGVGRGRLEGSELHYHLEFLEEGMKAYLEELQAEKNQQNRCDLMQKVCDLIFSEDLDTVECQHLSEALCHLLYDDINHECSLLPSDVRPETIRELLATPLDILFDNLVTLSEDDHRRQSLLLLLAEMNRISPRLGYHLLYFLKASTVRTDKDDDNRVVDRSAMFKIYRDLCKASGQKDFAGFILRDVQLCCENDPRLISWIVPDLYQQFPKQTMGNVELLQRVLERLDSSQLHDLVCMVLQGSLQMFDNNSFATILERSLRWESVEQIFLWQLARAHEVPVDCCLPVLPKLKFSSHTADVSSTHGEALSNILMMLRRESPSETLLKHLLNRDLRPSDPTVATILEYWVQRYEDKMAKLVNDIVNNKQPPSPNKRMKRSLQNLTQMKHAYATVPLDQVLSHLNHLRKACDQTKFFGLQAMQEALQTAQNNCTEHQKKKYSDLFALIEDSGESGPPPPDQVARKVKGNPRGRKSKGRKKQQESESEDESSEEEDVKKPARKRKKNNQVGSDSD